MIRSRLQSHISLLAAVRATNNQSQTLSDDDFKSDFKYSLHVRGLKQLPLDFDSSFLACILDKLVDGKYSIASMLVSVALTMTASPG